MTWEDPGGTIAIGKKTEATKKSTFTKAKSPGLDRLSSIIITTGYE